MLVDTHAHLDDPRLRSRLAEVLEAARIAGVAHVVAISTTAADSESVVDLARSHPGVFAAIGIHPNDSGDAKGADWDKVVGLATCPEVVAIGETGLDRHWDRTPFDVQQDFFGRHLDLAHRLDLPIVIHSRECHRDIVDQLTTLDRPIKGILHSFTGNWAEAEELLALGLHLSFAGMVTFASKALDPLRDVAARAPIDRILVETDSPYLSPHPHRGKVNEPARVAFTAARVAEVRGVAFEELAVATTQNARRLFGIPADRSL